MPSYPLHFRRLGYFQKVDWHSHLCFRRKDDCQYVHDWHLESKHFSSEHISEKYLDSYSEECLLVVPPTLCGLRLYKWLDCVFLLNGFIIGDNYYEWPVTRWQKPRRQLASVMSAYLTFFETGARTRENVFSRNHKGYSLGSHFFSWRQPWNKNELSLSLSDPSPSLSLFFHRDSFSPTGVHLIPYDNNIKPSSL